MVCVGCMRAHVRAFRQSGPNGVRHAWDNDSEWASYCKGVGERRARGGDGGHLCQ